MSTKRKELTPEMMEAMDALFADQIRDMQAVVTYQAGLRDYDAGEALARAAELARNRGDIGPICGSCHSPILTDCACDWEAGEDTGHDVDDGRPGYLDRAD